MPSLYAHYTFGQKVLEKLEPDKREIIESAIELYNIGLHGPDILYYHKPLSLGKSETKKLGTTIHRETGKEYFSSVKNIIERNNYHPSFLAYLFGYTCHFVLDSKCHPFINGELEKHGLRHIEIETEFDRFLMEMDKKDPINTCLTSHIIPANHNTNVITPFFENVTVDEINSCLNSLIKVTKIMQPKSNFKRKIINFLLKVSGNKSNCDLMMISEPNLKCAETDKVLLAYYNESIDDCVEAINEIYDFVKNDKPLGPIFDRVFG